MTKILLTGGSGVLGSEIRKISAHTIIAPTSEECNILSDSKVFCAFIKEKPDIVIHAAAYTNVKKAELNPCECINANVIGTFNILNACRTFNTKLVYISTDYVFDGIIGNYKTTDAINPLSNYAKTKAAAELIVRTYKNTLVIRTSFYPKEFPYEYACTDLWTTKDYVDIIAPKVLQASLSDERGIMHIGSARRSVYEIAKSRNKDVMPISHQELNFPIPKDTSLIQNA